MAEDEARELVSRPASDPSALTTNALHRAIADVKELFEIRLNGELKSQATRIEAVEKAAEAFNAQITRVPTETQQAISGEHALTDERFKGVEKQFADNALLAAEKFQGIQIQFRERDTRIQETGKQAETAIGAALQAAKEAVGKSEVVTKAQLDEQKMLFNTAIGALRDRLDDFGERFAKIEGLLLGQASQKQDHSSSSNFTVALVGLGITIILGLITAFAFFQRLGGK